MNLSFKFVESPVGKLKLVASEHGLVAIGWEQDNQRFVLLDGPLQNTQQSILTHAEVELSEYFAGKRTKFSVPLDIKGTTFQRRVWESLIHIPYGETRTYGQLAIQVGNPTAARAVGAANSRNPIAIIVPCHRVIGSLGHLTGFAGGLDAKAHLLKLEGAMPFFW